MVGTINYMEDTMTHYDEKPTFFSNRYWSPKQICAEIDGVRGLGLYSRRFHEFSDCRNEDAIRRMLSPWLLDMDQMRARREGEWDYPKPRITIYAEINSKDNLSIWWTPTHYGDDDRSDFSHIPSHGSNAWANRPNMELLFIRDVRHPLVLLGKKNEQGPVDHNLAGLFIKGINRQLSDLDRDLSWHFEITWEVHVTIRETEHDNGDRYISEAYMETTAGKAARELKERHAAVQAKFASFEETYGFSLDHYITVRDNAPTETLIGKPMSDMGRNRHVAKILREQGHDLTGTTISTIEKLIEEREQIATAIGQPR